jgi:hypothetical protein
MNRGWQHAAIAVAVLAASAGTASAAPADNCEEIRSAIDQKIRRVGLDKITVTALEPGASAPGQVVGRCAQGTRLIVYRREIRTLDDIAAAKATSAPAAAPRPAPVITECRDGSAPVNGACPKK